MVRSRFFWSLYGTCAAVVAVATLTTSWAAAGRLAAVARDAATRDLESRAALLRPLAEPLLRGTPGAAIPGLRELGALAHTRLTVIAADGRVLADSHEEAARMDNHATRPEVVAAMRDGRGVSIRTSDTVHQDLVYVALSVRLDGVVRGCVRAAVPLATLEAQTAALRSGALAGGALAALVALAAGAWLARRVTAPLDAMTRAADALASGVEARLPLPTTRGEVGTLARAFARMAEQSRERFEALAAERNELRAILDSMMEGVVAVDREERVVHLNGVAGRLLRCAPDAAVGRRIWEITRVEAVTTVLAAAREGPVAREVRLTEDRAERVIGLHAAPLRDARGAPSGAVVVLEDVTELRRLEAVRRDFVANVSHELKTPVTAIRGLVETLLDDATMEPETHRRFLGKVRDQATRLSALVTDLLTLARLEADPHVLDREEMDFADPLRAAAQAIAPAAEQQGLALSVELPDTPVPVLADAEALRQVADNLLSNAVKYTPQGGRVTLRLRIEGTTAVCEIQDTGIGIEPRHQERIFERFYRVDKARSREMGGTGLGLAIVRHIAIAHGGRVDVTSAPGAGSTFRVELPLAAEAAASE